ncbi:MAG TPA: NAD(P)/FAD-dependent oxidoreductase [Candidatus Dormibacteraeota bacterium]|nr:NAD(P)/FAD-dependent oxidoreductase [Candidatus Dormibacteraeota bacterium]
MRRFDVVILGGGSGAEAICGSGLNGLSVAVIEELRFGGECPFVACMPSKAMLFSAALHRAAADRAPREPQPEAYLAAALRRDRVAEQRDDSQHLQALKEQGVEAIRGHGRILSAGLLEVGSERIEVGDLVIATGSEPTLPSLAGLDQVDYWLSDRVLSTSDLPRSAAILGGGPVGCELAQILVRYGCRTVLIEVGDGLLAAEEPELGQAVAETLQSDGVEVLVGRQLESVSSSSADEVSIHLTEDEPQEVQVLVVAAGRHPRIHGLGLEAYGLKADASQLPIDGHCRALGHRHLFGVGDVTGVAPFTHTANYQGKVVAANLRGGDAVADYRAIPRAVYTDPPVASVGLTRLQARQQGMAAVSATCRLRDTARALAEDVRAGELVLVADSARRVLVGAAIAGPGADESIGWAALAIKAGVSLEVLRDSVPPFPTYSEAYLAALEALAI